MSDTNDGSQSPTPIIDSSGTNLVMRKSEVPKLLNPGSPMLVDTSGDGVSSLRSMSPKSGSLTVYRNNSEMFNKNQSRQKRYKTLGDV